MNVSYIKLCLQNRLTMSWHVLFVIAFLLFGTLNADIDGSSSSTPTQSSPPPRIHHAHRQTRSPLRVPVVKGRIPYSFSSDSPLANAHEVHAAEITGPGAINSNNGQTKMSLRPPVITKQISSPNHHAHAMASVAAAAAAAAAVAVKSAVNSQALQHVSQQPAQPIVSNHVTGLPIVAAMIEPLNSHHSSSISSSSQPSSSPSPQSSYSSSSASSSSSLSSSPLSTSNAITPVSVNLDLEPNSSPKSSYSSSPSTSSSLSSSGDHGYKSTSSGVSSSSPSSSSGTSAVGSVNIHNHQSQQQLQAVSHRLKASSSTKSMKMSRFPLEELVNAIAQAAIDGHIPFNKVDFNRPFKQQSLQIPVLLLRPQDLYNKNNAGNNARSGKKMNIKFISAKPIRIPIKDSKSYGKSSGSSSSSSVHHRGNGNNQNGNHLTGGGGGGGRYNNNSRGGGVGGVGGVGSNLRSNNNFRPIHNRSRYPPHQAQAHHHQQQQHHHQNGNNNNKHSVYQQSPFHNNHQRQMHHNTGMRHNRQNGAAFPSIGGGGGGVVTGAVISQSNSNAQDNFVLFSPTSSLQSPKTNKYLQSNAGKHHTKNTSKLDVMKLIPAPKLAPGGSNHQQHHHQQQQQFTDTSSNGFASSGGYDTTSTSSSSSNGQNGRKRKILKQTNIIRQHNFIEGDAQHKNSQSSSAGGNGGYNGERKRKVIKIRPEGPPIRVSGFGKEPIKLRAERPPKRGQPEVVQYQKKQNIPDSSSQSLLSSDEGSSNEFQNSITNQHSSEDKYTTSADDSHEQKQVKQDVSTENERIPEKYFKDLPPYKSVPPPKMSIFGSSDSYENSAEPVQQQQQQQHHHQQQQQHHYQQPHQQQSQHNQYKTSSSTTSGNIDFRSVFRKTEPGPISGEIQEDEKVVVKTTSSGPELKELEKSAYDKQLVRTLKNLMSTTSKRHKLNFEDKGDEAASGEKIIRGKIPDKYFQETDSNGVSQQSSSHTQQHTQHKSKDSLQESQEDAASASISGESVYGNSQEERGPNDQGNSASEEDASGEGEPVYERIPSYRVRGFDKGYMYMSKQDANEAILGGTYESMQANGAGYTAAAKARMQHSNANHEPAASSTIPDEVTKDGKKIKTYIQTGIYRQKLSEDITTQDGSIVGSGDETGDYHSQESINIDSLADPETDADDDMVDLAHYYSPSATLPDEESSSLTSVSSSSIDSQSESKTELPSDSVIPLTAVSSVPVPVSAQTLPDVLTKTDATPVPIMK